MRASALVVTAALLVAGVARGEVKPPTHDPVASSETQRAKIHDGVLLYDGGSYEAAAKTFSEVLAENPDNAVALYELAMAQFALGNVAEALETARKGASYRGETLGGFYMVSGNCLDELGKPEDALECYRAAQIEEPDNFLAFFNEALTLTRQNRLEPARAVLKSALLIEPDHASSHLLYGRILAAEGARFQALLALGRFLVLEPASPRSPQALERWRDLLNAGSSVKREGKNVTISLDRDPKPAGPSGEGDYRSLETALALFGGAAKALEGKEGGSPQSPVDGAADALKMMGELMAAADFRKEHTDFTATFYAPYFAELVAKGYAGVFAHQIFRSSGLPEIRTWFDDPENQKASVAFVQWSRAYRWPARPSGTSDPGRKP